LEISDNGKTEPEELNWSGCALRSGKSLIATPPYLFMLGPAAQGTRQIE
jgi:hypothetical protein